MDAAWQTSGRPAVRTSDTRSLQGPHQRYRRYYSDMETIAALRLEPGKEKPSTKAVAEALERPARPLFIGRKRCVPTPPILAGAVEADDLRAALLKCAGTTRRDWVASTPAAAWRGRATRTVDVYDLRLWNKGHHGGTRKVAEGSSPTLSEEGEEAACP